MSSYSIFAFSVFCILLGTSCSKTKSDLVNTKAWTASYEVKAEINQAVCEAKYQVGSGAAATFIELTGGDSVDCNGVTMTRADSVVGEIIYKTAVPVSNLYTLTLHRIGEQNYSSMVTGPTAFNLNQPTADQVLSKQRDLVVNWPASNLSTDRMLIYLTFTETAKNSAQSGTKFRTYSQMQETGNYTILAADTPGGVDALETGRDVSAVLQLTRVHFGMMAEGLEGRIVGSRTLMTNLTFR